MAARRRGPSGHRNDAMEERNTQTPRGRAPVRPTRRVRPGEDKIKKRTPSPNKRIDSKSLPRVLGPNRPITDVANITTDIQTQMPPHCRANFVTKDTGSASSRFIRLTQYLIPQSKKIADQTGLSVGAIVQPLANTGLEEEPVQLVDVGEKLPKCVNCGAYVNRFVRFTRGGKMWRCSLCDNENTTPESYYCGTDGSGIRHDFKERPELMHGSVELIKPLPKNKPPAPKPTNYLFVIDISQQSHASGMLETMINGILDVIDQVFHEECEEDAYIGLVTYDSVVQVHTPNQVAIMNDVDRPFLPVPSSEVLVSIRDVEGLEALIERMNNFELLTPTTAPRDPTRQNSCFGAASQIAYEILAEQGGRAMMSVMHLPNVGIGKLKNRDNAKFYGTKKEKELLIPQNAWYRNLVDKASEASVSFDLFVGAANHCDVLTISQLSHYSGGTLYHYANFNQMKDAEGLQGDLLKCIQRFFGTDAYIVIRHSPGLVLLDTYGGFILTENEEIRYAQINSDTTFTMTFEYTEDLPKDKPFTLQIGILYTPRDTGESIIRLHTIRRPVKSNIQDVFRSIDLESVMSMSAKECVQRMMNQHSEEIISQASERLVSGCITVLCKYRRHCASRSNKTQLILPETLKLLPLFTLGFLKCPGLDVRRSIDERVSLLRTLATSTVSQTLLFLYSNLFSLHNLTGEACTYDGQGFFALPSYNQLTKDTLFDDGLYLMNTGKRLYLLIGRQLDSDLFDSLFVQENGQVYLLDPPEDPDYDDLLYRITLIIDELRMKSPYHLSLHILFKPDRNAKNNKQSIDQLAFDRFMIDDTPLVDADDKNARAERKKNPRRMGYIDFLVFCHGRVKREMSK